MRRVGTYFHSEAKRSSPWRVRAPHTMRPAGGLERRQLTPSGFSAPFSASVSGTESWGTPRRVASRPAGAVQTPRAVSVRAITPASAPQGAKVSIWPSRSVFACRRRGKYSAALALVVPTPAAMPATACSRDVQLEGGSTSSMARRASQYAAACVQTLSVTSVSASKGGTQSRLKMSASSSAYIPVLSASLPRYSSVPSALPSEAWVLTPLEVAASKGSAPGGTSGLAAGRAGGRAPKVRTSLDSTGSTRSIRRGWSSSTLRLRITSTSPVEPSRTDRLNRLPAPGPATS